jgi:HlyD family secretion protein
MTDSRNLSAALLALLALASCKDAPAPGWSGYAEGDYVYVAAPVAGRLQQLTVQAGDQVKGGAPLFALDVTNEREAAAAAQAQASAAQAQAANLDTGRRPDEIAAIEAQLAQARALATQAQAAKLARFAALVGAGRSLAQRDGRRSRHRCHAGRSARQRAAGQPAHRAPEPARAAGARRRQRASPDARVEAALAQQRWRVEQAGAQAAPADAQVAETCLPRGRMGRAPASPWCRCCRPRQMKARFFVPETDAGARCTAVRRCGSAATAAARRSPRTSAASPPSPSTRRRSSIPTSSAPSWSSWSRRGPMPRTPRG